MMKKGGGSLFPPPFYVQQSAGKIFWGVIGHFVCFFMPMKIVFVNFIGAIIKDRCCGMKIFHLINLENFLKRQPGQLLRVNKSQNSAEFYGNQ